MLQPKLEPSTLPPSVLQIILSEIRSQIRLRPTLSPSGSLIQVFQSNRRSETRGWACTGWCLCSVFAVSRHPAFLLYSVSIWRLYYPTVLTQLAASRGCTGEEQPPAHTKSPNRRITFSGSTLIWLLGTLGFMVLFVRHISVNDAAWYPDYKWCSAVNYWVS